MDLGMAGQKAVVTGGSKGIGRETARLLAEEGVDVAIIARDPERLEKVAAELAAATGRTIIPIAGDTSRLQGRRAHDGRGTGAAGPRRHPRDVRGELPPGGRWRSSRRSSGCPA